MTILESLQQFFLAGLDVLRAVVQVLEPHLGLYIGLALWILFWTGAVNWVRLHRILYSQGGFIGLLLIAFLTVLVWGTIAPPPGGRHFILGLQPSNYFGKMIYVTGFLCIMLICGSVQLAINPHQEEEEPAEEHHGAHSHGHSH